MDPFHTVAWATEAVDEVRRATVRALTTNGDKAGLQLVKGSRWALLKNPANLTATQAGVLASVKEANTDLFTAHVLKEQLRAVSSTGFDGGHQAWRNSDGGTAEVPGGATRTLDPDDVGSPSGPDGAFRRVPADW